MKQNIFKKILIIFLLFIFCVLQAFAETEADMLKEFDFKAFQIKGKYGEDINFYVSSYSNMFLKKKPLFINIQGSGAQPLICKNKNGGLSGGFFMPTYKPFGGLKEINTDYYYILVAKPGFTFWSNEDYWSDENVKVPEIYNKLTSLSYRVEIISQVIDYCVAQPWVDSKKIVVSGHSEGSDVAAKVAVINKKVTHLGFFGGSGASQMFDFVMYVRNDVLTGKITPEEGEKRISALYEQFKDIYAHPNATDKFWEGHTYLRWSSFFSEPSVENLLKLNIPIFIGIGALDESSSLESADIIPVEFIRHGKTNLVYKTYLNCDHSFREFITDKNGNEKIIDHENEVTKDFLDWIKKN